MACCPFPCHSFFDTKYILLTFPRCQGASLTWGSWCPLVIPPSLNLYVPYRPASSTEARLWSFPPSPWSLPATTHEGMACWTWWPEAIHFLPGALPGLSNISNLNYTNYKVFYHKRSERNISSIYAGYWAL